MKNRWFGNLAPALLLEGVSLLILARLFLLVPLQRLTLVLGQMGAESAHALDLPQIKMAGDIGRAVEIAAARLPGTWSCLAQAVAGKIMLRRRGIASTVYLGVSTANRDKLRAHAWLRAGDVLVTGEEGINEFHMLTSFSEKMK